MMPDVEHLHLRDSFRLSESRRGAATLTQEDDARPQ